MMQTEHLIPADVFCEHHQLEFSFISSLNSFGLIRVITQQNSYFIEEDELPKLEKIVRLHNDLQINLEGIEVIMDILQRINRKEEEINALKNKLRLYESD